MVMDSLINENPYAIIYMWTSMKEIFCKNETLLNNIQNLKQKQQQEDENMMV